MSWERRGRRLRCRNGDRGRELRGLGDRWEGKCDRGVDSVISALLLGWGCERGGWLGATIRREEASGVGTNIVGNRGKVLLKRRTGWVCARKQHRFEAWVKRAGVSNEMCMEHVVGVGNRTMK